MGNIDEPSIRKRIRVDKQYGIADCFLPFMVIGGLYFLKLTIPIYINTICTRDIGEGFKVTEVRKWRRIYDEKTDHFYYSHKGGTLEQVGKLMAVPPSLGGPGWASSSIEPSLEDRIRFQMANYLLEKGGR